MKPDPESSDPLNQSAPDSARAMKAPDHKLGIRARPNGILPEFVRILAPCPLDGKAKLWKKKGGEGRGESTPPYI